MKNILTVLLFAFCAPTYANELKPIFSSEHEVKDSLDNLSFMFSPKSQFLYLARFSSGTEIINSENGAKINGDLKLATYWIDFRDQNEQVIFHGNIKSVDHEFGFAHYVLDIPSGQVKTIESLANDLGVIMKRLIVSDKIAMTQSYKNEKDPNYIYNIFDIDSGKTLCKFELEKNLQAGRWSHLSTRVDQEVFFDKNTQKAVLFLNSDSFERYISVYDCVTNNFEIKPIKANISHAKFVSLSGQFLISSIINNGPVDEVFIYDLHNNAKLVATKEGQAFWNASRDTLLVKRGYTSVTSYSLSDTQIRSGREVSLNIAIGNIEDQAYIDEIKYSDDRFWIKYHFSKGYGLGYLKTSDEESSIIHLTNVDKYFPIYSRFSNSEKVIVSVAEKNNQTAFKEIDLNKMSEKLFNLPGTFRTFQMSPDGKKLAVYNFSKMSEKLMETLSVFNLETIEQK